MPPPPRLRPFSFGGLFTPFREKRGDHFKQIDKEKMGEFIRIRKNILMMGPAAI